MTLHEFADLLGGSIAFSAPLVLIVLLGHRSEEIIGTLLCMAFLFWVALYIDRL